MEIQYMVYRRKQESTMTKIVHQIVGERMGEVRG
jgi:hypothetical protein